LAAEVGTRSEQILAKSAERMKPGDVDIVKRKELRYEDTDNVETTPGDGGISEPL
jgi:hypothetical protein